MVIGRGLSAIRVDNKALPFLWHALKWSAPRLSQYAQGSTFVAVSRLDVESLLIPWGDEETCAGIATILDVVDEAIAKTEAVIAKLKQVRAGLLHDLLTRGLDGHGQLRPLSTEAPHLYKDSPLGKIPKDWRICGVLDAIPSDRQPILTGPFGTQLGQYDFVTNGVPVLRIGNVQAGYLDWTDVQFVSEAKANELKRYKVRAGDLLFARQGATTGRNALADDRADGALINYHIIRVAVDQDKFEPVFLHAIFNSEQAMGQINRDKGRGTREGINTEQISSLRFALPGITEQRRAVDVLNKHDADEGVEVATQLKLSKIKSGLTADLLTGRVRVPMEAAHA